MIVLVIKLELREGKKDEFIKIARLMVEGSQKVGDGVYGKRAE